MPLHQKRLPSFLDFFSALFSFKVLVGCFLVSFLLSALLLIVFAPFEFKFSATQKNGLWFLHIPRYITVSIPVKHILALTHKQSKASLFSVPCHRLFYRIITSFETERDVCGDPGRGQVYIVSHPSFAEEAKGNSHQKGEEVLCEYPCPGFPIAPFLREMLKFAQNFS